MQFALVCIASIVVLGVVAAIASLFDRGSDEIVVSDHDCSSCSAAADETCAIHCLMEQKKQAQGNNSATK